MVARDHPSRESPVTRRPEDELRRCGRDSLGRRGVSGAGMLRLFVAAELPAPVRQSLATIQDDLRRRLPGEAVRWTRPEGIHLTLKFLGDVAGQRVEAIGGVLAGALAGRSCPQLRLAGLGSFGGPRRLRVIWVGLAGETEGLSDLAASVDAALAALGFSPARRPFTGHLTLGRVRDRVPPAERLRMHRQVAAAAATAAPAFAVERAVLVSSTLQPGGARYERLRVFPLG